MFVRTSNLKFDERENQTFKCEFLFSAISPPFEFGLEHFNVALLLITSHLTSPKRESRCKSMGDTINQKM